MTAVRIVMHKNERISWTGQVVKAGTVVKEFDDDHEAAHWLMSDSYFEEPYVQKFTWERVQT